MFFHNPERSAQLRGKQSEVRACVRLMMTASILRELLRLARVLSSSTFGWRLSNGRPRWFRRLRSWRVGAMAHVASPGGRCCVVGERRLWPCHGAPVVRHAFQMRIDPSTGQSVRIPAAKERLGEPLPPTVIPPAHKLSLDRTKPPQVRHQLRVCLKHFVHRPTSTSSSLRAPFV